MNISYWILQTVAMLLTALLIPKLRIEGPFSAILTVIALAFINSHIWDAALFMQVPDSLTHHALVVFGANGLLFWLVVKILPGIEVSGVIPALLAPIVFSLVSMFLGTYAKDIDWEELGRISLKQVQEFRDSLLTKPRD